MYQLDRIGCKLLYLLSVKKSFKMITYRINSEIKRKIIQLKNDGVPVTEIANEVGVAVSIFYDIQSEEKENVDEVSIFEFNSEK